MMKRKITLLALLVGLTGLSPASAEIHRSQRSDDNIFITETELFYMEPQTGKVLDLTGDGYTAHYVVWG